MYELDKARFGSFVAQLRKEKGLTQKALAQQLFISDKAVSKWETGVSVPDTALLIPLAEALGVTVTGSLDDIRRAVIKSAEDGRPREAIELLNESRFRIFDAILPRLKER